MEIKDIDNLATLARLELSYEEKEKMLKDLGNILGYVKQIESLEVSEVGREQKLSNVWREDKIEKREFSRDLIIGQFPEAQNGFLKVKKIL